MQLIKLGQYENNNSSRKKIIRYSIALGINQRSVIQNMIILYFKIYYHVRMTVGRTRSFVTGAHGFPSIIGATNPPPNPKNPSVIELFVLLEQ